jgi:Cu/Ag efflux pump CusA
VLLPVKQSRDRIGSGATDMASMGSGATAASGADAQIPLGQVARITEVSGPMAIKTEGAFPTAWV